MVITVELNTRAYTAWEEPLAVAQMALSEKKPTPAVLKDCRPLVLLGSVWQGVDAQLNRQVMGFRKGNQPAEMITTVFLNALANGRSRWCS